MEAGGGGEAAGGTAEEGSLSMTTRRVDYAVSCRRHWQDANTLLGQNARPNAGQLFGLSVECGLKAVLIIRRSVEVAADGSIREDLQTHLPRIAQQALEMTTLADSRAGSGLRAAVPSLGKMHDWQVEHRYWRPSEVPLDSLPHWQAAAREMLNYLDNVISGDL